MPDSTGIPPITSPAAGHSPWSKNKQGVQRPPERQPQQRDKHPRKPKPGGSTTLDEFA